jgi:predicted nucleic acid-binding protein
MFILDTNVVSEVRKVASGKADPLVAKWADGVEPSTLFLSAITILELEAGVLKIERRDTTQGRALRDWLEGAVLPTFDGRILPVDVAVARRCARLQSPDPRRERDALIAATAMVHAMTVVTRDLADFEPIGVSLLNPWLRS